MTCLRSTYSQNEMHLFTRFSSFSGTRSGPKFLLFIWPKIFLSDSPTKLQGIFFNIKNVINESKVFCNRISGGMRAAELF
jgi:hypothetical protein